MELPESKVELVRRGNKVVYDCGDRIVKVFNVSKPESDVFNEALNLARIQETGIRVPKILEVSKSPEGWALATEKVPGTTLAERMQADTKKNQDQYLEQFVIVGEDGLLYVCDWAHATQGSPAADAAMTYLLFALENLDLADRYLIMFCKMADMPMQVVRRWTSIVAASELARHRDAHEEEFLRSWIDVAEYQ